MPRLILGRNFSSRDDWVAFLFISSDKLGRWVVGDVIWYDLNVTPERPRGIPAAKSIDMVYNIERKRVVVFRFFLLSWKAFKRRLEPLDTYLMHNQLGHLVTFLFFSFLSHNPLE